jgi:RNA polymerase sigma factor (TIGR02999 family)
MRDLLVDHCRRQRAARHGGSQVEVPLSDDVSAAVSRVPVDLLVLDDVLNRLSTIKPRYTQIVELKFFAGLTIDESAAVLQTSHATIEREWKVARLWLRRELGA